MHGAVFIWLTVHYEWYWLPVIGSYRYVLIRNLPEYIITYTENEY